MQVSGTFQSLGFLAGLCLLPALRDSAFFITEERLNFSDRKARILVVADQQHPKESPTGNKIQKKKD